MTGSRRFLAGIGLFITLVFLAPQSHARGKNLGLGIIVGAPTGISGKVWFNDTHAVDFAMGTFGYYVGSPYYSVNLHADYLWHFYGVFGRRGSKAYRNLPLYFGVGGMMTNPGVAGVRGVLGITYLFERPFDVFLEVVPTLVVVPGTGLGTDAGLGGRFYF